MALSPQFRAAGSSPPEEQSRGDRQRRRAVRRCESDVLRLVGVGEEELPSQGLQAQRGAPASFRVAFARYNVVHAGGVGDARLDVYLNPLYGFVLTLDGVTFGVLRGYRDGWVVEWDLNP